MIAANHVFNIAKPDGLTLGSLSPALYYAQLTGSKEVKFDWPKFTWIGSPERNGHVLFMRSDSPVQDSRRYSRRQGTAALFGHRGWNQRP